MPETPDFEKIANQVIEQLKQQLTDALMHYDRAPRSAGFDIAPIVEQLRLMWNARGAVDIAKIEHELSSMMGATAAGPYLKNLDRSLRGLDR